VRTGVITDSTAYLPAGWALAHDVCIVPVQVIVDAHARDETNADQAAFVISALRSGAQVTTSRPAPTRFTEAIEHVRDSGCEQAVILTLSSALSGTYEAACAAGAQSKIPVEVVDSRSIGMGLGFAVMAAVLAVASGADAHDAAARATEQALNTQIYFYVDTLEYLRRGGRIGNTNARVGTALQVKPILQIADGRVEPVDRVRTESKAIARLIELGLAAQAGRPCLVSISDLDAPERVEAVIDQWQVAAPDSPIIRSTIGGVVGAHTGPGVIAIAITPEAGLTQVL